jgi:hypothetical protein
MLPASITTAIITTRNKFHLGFFDPAGVCRVFFLRDMSVATGLIEREAGAREDFRLQC